MSALEAPTVDLELWLERDLNCWVGGHGAEVRVMLVCCGKEAFGCEAHYAKWRANWEAMADRYGRIDCKSCEARFTSVDEAIRAHPV